MNEQTSTEDVVLSVSDAQLLDELRRVRGELTWRARVRRWLRWIVATLVIALVASLLALGAFVGVLRARHEACGRDNDLRRAYAAQWQPVLSLPPAALPPNPTDEQRRQYDAAMVVRQRFADSLTNGFAQHAC